MKTDFLPCPFCGEVENLASESTDGRPKRYFIWCMTCGTEGPKHIDTEDEYVSCVELWNNRTKE